MRAPSARSATAFSICTRCHIKIHWNGVKWTSTDTPIEECLPGLGYDHRPADPLPEPREETPTP